MRVAVDYGDEQLDLEIPEDRLIASWRGPSGVTGDAARQLVRAALETPRNYPPLRQAVVSGDRVVIAFDAGLPEPGAVLAAVVAVVRAAGVEPEAITILVASGAGEALAGAVPEGVALATHDPDDRERLAYLSATAEGRRVYLARLLTDADFVLPVGRLGFDPVLGYRGPWSIVYPGLSDRETGRHFHVRSGDVRPDPARPGVALAESVEVSWLLGSQFQLAAVPGTTGLAEVVAGLDATVREEGARAVEAAWGFRAADRADLVVAGIGRPGVPTTIDDLAEGLTTAARVVRRGGKIVALSRAGGMLGPACRRLIAAGDPRAGLAALKGHETDPDVHAARQFARALAWADVYLFSALPQDDVEDLSMIALEHPKEAQRLVAGAASVLVFSRAEQVRAVVADEAE